MNPQAVSQLIDEFKEVDSPGFTQLVNLVHDLKFCAREQNALLVSNPSNKFIKSMKTFFGSLEELANDQIIELRAMGIKKVKTESPDILIITSEKIEELRKIHPESLTIEEAVKLIRGEDVEIGKVELMMPLKE